MRRTWRKAKPKDEKKFKTNQQIKATEVFLIDETGENVGVISLREALVRAQEIGMDLVEVNPQAEPPVVKIIDHGQFKYEKEKRAHKQKLLQKKVDTKGVRISVRISKHDFDFRVKQAEKFLKKGNKLKIELILKGREKAHPEKAIQIINEFAGELEKIADLQLDKEQDLTKQGGRFIMILVNKKSE